MKWYKYPSTTKDQMDFSSKYLSEQSYYDRTLPLLEYLNSQAAPDDGKFYSLGKVLPDYVNNKDNAGSLAWELCNEMMNPTDPNMIKTSEVIEVADYLYGTGINNALLLYVSKKLAEALRPLRKGTTFKELIVRLIENYQPDYSMEIQLAICTVCGIGVFDQLDNGEKPIQIEVDNLMPLRLYCQFERETGKKFIWWRDTVNDDDLKALVSGCFNTDKISLYEESVGTFVLNSMDCLGFYFDRKGVRESLSQVLSYAEKDVDYDVSDAEMLNLLKDICKEMLSEMAGGSSMSVAEIKLYNSILLDFEPSIEDLLYPLIYEMYNMCNKTSNYTTIMKLLKSGFSSPDKMRTDYVLQIVCGAMCGISTISDIISGRKVQKVNVISVKPLRIQYTFVEENVNVEDCYGVSMDEIRRVALQGLANYRSCQPDMIRESISDSDLMYLYLYQQHKGGVL